MCVRAGAKGQALLLLEMIEARLEELSVGGREQDRHAGSGGGQPRDVQGERKVLEELRMETRANLELMPKIAKERRALRRAAEERQDLQLLRLQQRQRGEEQEELQARVRARHARPPLESQQRAQPSPRSPPPLGRREGAGGPGPVDGEGSGSFRRGGGTGMAASSCVTSSSPWVTSWMGPALGSPAPRLSRGGAPGGGVFTRLARLLSARPASAGWGLGGWRRGRKGAECLATPQSAAGETGRDGSRAGQGRGRGGARGAGPVSRATPAKAEPGAAPGGGRYLYVAGGKFGDPEDDELDGGKYPSVRTLRLSLDSQAGTGKAEWEVICSGLMCHVMCDRSLVHGRAVAQPLPGTASRESTLTMHGTDPAARAPTALTDFWGVPDAGDGESVDV